MCKASVEYACQSVIIENGALPHSAASTELRCRTSVSQNSPKCLHSRAFILKSTDQIDLNLCLLESVGIFKAIYVHFSPIKGYYNTEIICTKNVHDR